MFDPKSRYANLTPLAVSDHRGRQVSIVPAPDAPVQAELGIYKRRQGERLDHLAQLYLNDPAGFWRIAEINGVMLAEDLLEALEITIPGKVR